MPIIVERAKKTRKCHKCNGKIKAGEKCLNIVKHGYPYVTVINICGNCIMDIGEEMITKDNNNE